MPAPGTPTRPLLAAVPAGAGYRDDPAPGRRGRPREVVVAAVLATPAAWAALVVTACLISEIAASATFKPGVASSTWTPLRGVGAFVVGAQAFGGGFAPLPILYGLAALAVYAAIFVPLGVVLICAIQGTGPGVVGAVVQGVVYAGFLQALVVNALITGLIQTRPTVWESMPPWGWWAAHVAFGATLGLVTAARGRAKR
jgi:hypothetical protein